jgi:hypothetical protein
MRLYEFIEKKFPYTGTTRKPDFVMGKELENTKNKGLKTLFVTNVDDLDLVEQLYKETKAKQMYFEFTHGIRQQKNTNNVINKFKKALDRFLPIGIPIALDTPAEFAEEFADYGKHKNLILNILVQLPQLDKHNKNTVIKLGDNFKNGKNKGIYVASISAIKNKKNMTPKSKYNNNDVEIKP